MKKILIPIAILTIISCNSSDLGINMEKRDQSMVQTKPLNNSISFKINGQEITSRAWTIGRFALSSDPTHVWLNITSDMHVDKRTIMANLNGTVPGIYALSEGGSMKNLSYANYKPDYTGDMLNSFSFISGAFTIAELDTVKNILNGNFSGTAKNTKGEIIEITDGKIINCSLKQGINMY